ncbi:MAG: hypothetical protein FWB72_04220 [Firmicutes bacterium]|nr:hypothetical protein [Bacillota bacterium]
MERKLLPIEHYIRDNHLELDTEVEDYYRVNAYKYSAGYNNCDCMPLHNNTPHQPMMPPMMPPVMPPPMPFGRNTNKGHHTGQHMEPHMGQHMGHHTHHMGHHEPHHHIPNHTPHHHKSPKRFLRIFRWNENCPLLTLKEKCYVCGKIQAHIARGELENIVHNFDNITSNNPHWNDFHAKNNNNHSHMDMPHNMGMHKGAEQRHPSAHENHFEKCLEILARQDKLLDYLFNITRHSADKDLLKQIIHTKHETAKFVKVQLNITVYNTTRKFIPPKNMCLGLREAYALQNDFAKLLEQMLPHHKTNHLHTLYLAELRVLSLLNYLLTFC